MIFSRADASGFGKTCALSALCALSWWAERIRSAVRPACRVCAGIGILSAEENAAMAAGRSDGIDREGNGHGIKIQIVRSKCHACWSFLKI
jgi:hypothetical protein